METVLPFKVCDSSRRVRHIVFANANIRSLMDEASRAFNRHFQQIVIESEGCELSNDFALTFFGKDMLMLLEAGEIWTPERYHAPDTPTTNEQGAGLHDIASNTLAIPSFQTVNIDSNATSENQQSSAPDPIAMELMSDIESQQIIVIQPSTSKQETVTIDEQYVAYPVFGSTDASIQPSTSKQGNVITEEQIVEDPVSDSFDDSSIDENISPNAVMKRPGTTVQKSAKKHASTDIKFRSFEINWSKMSDTVLTKLNDMNKLKLENSNGPIPAARCLNQSDTRSLINIIVDQLRGIDCSIRAQVMETVAKQILNKYPCLEATDDDGFGNGMSYVVVKQKLIDRNNYLNRFKATAETKRKSSDNSRNMRAGTLKIYWQTTEKECAKETLSKLRRDEPAILTNEFLSASQAYVRYLLSESADLNQLLLEYTVIRRRNLLYFHFERATGVSVTDLRKYYEMKRTKIIKYSAEAGRKYPTLNDNSSSLDVFNFLACLVGESLNNLISTMEVGTRIEDIKLESAGPILVGVDMGQDRMYYVYGDHARLSEGSRDIVCALQDLFAVHFVYNFKYSKPVSKLLELIQQYFLKIIPAAGSRSNAYKIGNVQRVVQRVIAVLSNLE